MSSDGDAADAPRTDGPTSADLKPGPEPRATAPRSGTFAAPDAHEYTDVPPSDGRRAGTAHRPAAEPRPPRPKGRDGVPRGPLRALYDLRFWALAALVTAPALLWPLAWLIVACVVAAVVGVASGGGLGAVRVFVRLLFSLLVGALLGLILVALVAGAVAALTHVGAPGLLVYAHATVAATHWGLRWGTYLGATWTVRRAVGAGVFSAAVAERGREIAAPVAAVVLAAAVVAVVGFAQTTTHWASPLAAVNPGLQRSIADQLVKATVLTGSAELGSDTCTGTPIRVTHSDSRLVVTTPGSLPAAELVRLAAVVHNTLNPFVAAVLIRTSDGRGPAYVFDRYLVGTRHVADRAQQVAVALLPVAGAPRVTGAGVAAAGGSRFGARC